MKALSDNIKYTVAKEQNNYLAFTSIAKHKNKLICVYLRSDQHCRLTSDIMTAFSYDGGKTWVDHKVISHLDCKNDGAIWVVPEINSFPDGRLAIICDKGYRNPDEPFPFLTTWQMTRGMENHIFWSKDGGVTWDGPHKADDMGGEPERIHRLSNGALIYTRTEAEWKDDRYRFNEAIYNDLISKDAYENIPGTRRYYKNVAAFSYDDGKTWDKKVALADNCFHSDAEAGLCEFSDGNILAVTRCCDCQTYYGQPSRFIKSTDYGETWDKGVLSPIYAHRPIPGKLKSGKILVVYRNCFGTTATYAFVFDPEETFSYQPNSFIWDESRCVIEDGIMKINSGEDYKGAVDFVLYPTQDSMSRVVIEAELMVKESDINGCCISAGCWVSFIPGRIFPTDNPKEGVEFNTADWHKYKVVREKEYIYVYADGSLLFKSITKGISTRMVHFGNRHSKGNFAIRDYKNNKSLSFWRSVSVKVENQEDYSLDWEWSSSNGYPDQFRRDRFILIDKNASPFLGDNGYGGWVQMDDGTIVIVDYTRGNPRENKPFIRSYVVREEELNRPFKLWL